jgi:hypothetical protein
MWAMRKHIGILLLTATLFVAGCHHAGVVPPGWRSKHFSQTNGRDASHNTTAKDGLGNGSPTTGTLQVVICYGKLLSNHTALRLITPGESTLMWDPGGTYKQDDPAYARRHDVLTANAPSLDEWWRYRRDGCREPTMEVYEWSIDAEQARRLHALLIERRDPTDPTSVFEPDAGGLQCCTRVSELLMRFADSRPAVSKRYFWPHKLGEHLWTQNPDRVLIFRAQGRNETYRRNSDSTVAE